MSLNSACLLSIMTYVHIPSYNLNLEQLVTLKKVSVVNVNDISYKTEGCSLI